MHRYSCEIDVIIQIDKEGDGTFERIITSDNELTQFEFLLKTETTIDIDPDAINLKSAGNWITCYIELPNGFDVTDINISTILLNNTLPAESWPINISDYDFDGIMDLMVKFDLESVQDMLQPCKSWELVVNGMLYDGTVFEGVDYVKVI